MFIVAYSGALTERAGAIGYRCSWARYGASTGVVPPPTPTEIPPDNVNQAGGGRRVKGRGRLAFDPQVTLDRREREDEEAMIAVLLAWMADA